VVADHSKFNHVAPIRVENLERATHLVTDRRPEPPAANALAALPLELLVSDERPADR
jgi:DeoR/GlpR family transcriptional regulator of sugar metabolism